jgi:hypothetical protein
MWTKLLAQRLRESHHGELAGCVGRVAIDPDQAGQGGDIDDVATTLRHQCRDRGSRDADHAQVVRLHQPFEVGERGLQEAGRQRDPCVVDENVETAQGLDRLAHAAVDRVGIGHVQTDGLQHLMGVTPVGPQRLDCGSQALGVARCDHDVSPGSEQCSGRGLPNPTRAPGHEPASASMALAALLGVFTHGSPWACLSLSQRQLPHAPEAM